MSADVVITLTNRPNKRCIDLSVKTSSNMPKRKLLNMLELMRANIIKSVEKSEKLKD